MDRRRPGSQRSPGDEPTYSLDDLTSLAGVTVRTVRYYIAEGLLPPPLSRGRGAAYSHDHLERLLLITRLKEEYLPLKEIRHRLQGMSPDEVGAVLHGAGPASELREDDASAASYIEAALRSERIARHDARPPRQSPKVAIRHDAKDQAWRRLRISRDAELLIAEDAYRRREKQVDAAVTWIRRILDES
jgi:DNA-binding transcriptional MerR regulator